MKKIIASAGMVAVGATGLHAANYGDMPREDASKRWSVSAAVRGFYDDNYTNRGLSNSVPGRFAASYGVCVSGTIGNPAGPRPAEDNNYMDDGSAGSVTYVINGTSYQEVVAARFDGVFSQNSKRNLTAITDGTSNTVGVGERVRIPNGNPTGYWTIGDNDSQNRSSSFSGSLGIPINSTNTGQAGYPSFGSKHTGRGANFLFMDNSVHFISQGLSDTGRLALGTRSGNETNPVFE